MDSKDMGEKIIELEKALAKRTKENSNLSMKIDNLEYDFAFELKRETTERMTAFEEEKRMKKNLFERETCVFQIKIVELEKTLAKQTKENSDLLMKIDNLENAFADEVKRVTTGKLNVFDKENCDFVSKVTHLEKIIAQKTKDFDDVKLELSNRTTKFEAYFEKLKNTKVVLERQLARKIDDSKAEKDQFLKEINHLRSQLENLKGKSVQTKFDKHSILGKPPADKLLINSQISKSWLTPKVDVQKSLSKPVTTQSLPKNEKDQLLKRIAYLESKLASQDIRSCQKEYHELRTSYNALKVKFDSLNRQKWNINVSKSSKPKESVSEKVHTGESSKPFSRRVSQFTTYSLQKDRKFSKKSQSFETFSPHKGFKTRASNENNQSFETSHSCFTPVKQVWSPIKESQTFKASSSQKSFKTKMLSMQNKNDFASTINKKGRVSNETNFQDVSSNDINKWKSSSSTRFKTPFETPSFKNQWNIKRNFKSPLIPQELFSNETPVSSPRWNSTSLHRLDTTFNWFSKFGKPISTVLKWVPKFVV
ncbi:hypothetical protein Tco_0991412 [Tanacetum coccineum]|uniref:Uncharacterized protein n=1 Tax=Tanacetum coccineum TaxID=301880 RepID=A0ABQ5EZZ9_9ASTR